MAAHAALLVLVILSIFTAHLAPLIGPTATLVSYAICFAPYAVVLWFMQRRGFEQFWPLAIAALSARVVLSFADPYLSDDIFRYVWEGRVTLAGFNPFALAPDAAELAHLRDAEIWPRVNHPEISAIYPPVAQYLFAGIAAVGGGTTLMRLLFVVVEVAGIAALWRLLEPGATRRFAFAVYALNPLVMLEVAWSGHLDVLAWVPLTVALVILARRPATLRWGVLAGLLVGLSAAAKLLGLLLLPYFALRSTTEPWRRTIAHRAAVVLVSLGVLAGSYAGFADAGGKLFGGFGTYAASWRNNDGMFRVYDTLSWISLQEGEGEERIFGFEKWEKAALEHGFTKQWEGQTLPNTSFATNQISQFVAKALALFIVGLVLLWCIIAIRDPIHAALFTLLALYFVAPTVHPWYVAWLVPLAALRGSPTALVFSFVGLAGYASWWSFHSGGAWLTPWWVALLEYGIVFGVATWEIGKRKVDVEKPALEQRRPDPVPNRTS